jgi:hypothetical protein
VAHTIDCEAGLEDIAKVIKSFMLSSGYRVWDHLGLQSAALPGR